MNSQNLYNLSPIDGRYASKLTELKPYLSEYGLIKYRCIVEWSYLTALREYLNIPSLNDISISYLDDQIAKAQSLSTEDATEIKEIERTTNHDVKAVEYFIKKQLDAAGYHKAREWVHFALTSQDINNTAIPMSLRDATNQVLLPALDKVQMQLLQFAHQWREVPMLARTHGQAASPSSLGKEIYVFYDRLKVQIGKLRALEFSGKFGGATGNFNAHKVSFPDKNWIEFADHFCESHLGIKRQAFTTQIDAYDQIAEYFQCLVRINSILLDFCKDIWAYISIDYFKQKTVKDEVGSSAMPHKVNPIDFENAEGNLGLANSVANFMATKLPISRWQRDLTDSTVLRNISVPLSHSIIAYKSVLKGMAKIELNAAQVQSDLNAHPMVVAEAIQNILRREQFPEPYEALKSLTRGKHSIQMADIQKFIDQLSISEELKAELKKITPENYTGVYPEFDGRYNVLLRKAEPFDKSEK